MRENGRGSVLSAMVSVPAIALLTILLVACAPAGTPATPRDPSAVPAAGGPGATATIQPAAPAAAAQKPTSVGPGAPVTTRPAAPTVAAGVLKLLKTSPERGPVGSSITVTGEGLPAGKAANIVWWTLDGSYDTRVAKNSIEYVDRKFTDKRVILGQTTIDGQGRLVATFPAPEDYGELHDIYISVDNEDVAKGGFRLARSFTMSPSEGPVGTLITIKVTGLGWKAYESTAALTYDNKYTGFISATTTRGTAVFQFRASGPAGKHFISVDGASHTLPYLNVQQSPVAQLVPFKQVFTVTDGSGPIEARLDWPDQSKVVAGDKTPRTTLISGNAPGVNARLSATYGPILSSATLNATGLPAGTTADIAFLTVLGNRVIGGWDVIKTPMGQVQVGSDGSVNTTIAIPEGLGGWHAVALMVNDKIMAEVPFFVERSVVGVTPTRVKAGEKFTVQIKGVGWTELDNGVAVTYDNAYMGMACGFNSNGDVTIEFVATGGPGTHLIDLYPMIYDGGNGKYPWQYNLPHLTYAQDAPGLALGYRLPAIRLAIEVVE
ncbi:MAG: hypothetical protein EPO26_16740 [Chloroflexota bacterium]|nr:MAG: hypothetical protein EPO26_16740 [Chloroflexota bacterium]